MEIVKVDAFLCDLPVERQRTDAIQAFIKQETMLVTITTDEGVTGTGYAYTIGTQGYAVLRLLRADLIAHLNRRRPCRRTVDAGYGH